MYTILSISTVQYLDTYILVTKMYDTIRMTLSIYDMKRLAHGSGRKGKQKGGKD